MMARRDPGSRAAAIRAGLVLRREKANWCKQAPQLLATSKDLFEMVQLAVATKEPGTHLPRELPKAVSDAKSLLAQANNHESIDSPATLALLRHVSGQCPWCCPW